MVRVFFLIVVLLSSTLAWPQDTKGTIYGIVKDRQGAVIADATVLLVDLRTLQCQRIRSSADGGYRFEELKPGEYEVLIGYPVLATKTRTLKIKPGKTVEFSPELEVRSDASSTHPPD